MARTLREVESLPAGEASSILALEAGSEEEVLE
jgi:hypothetical protein